MSECALESSSKSTAQWMRAVSDHARCIAPRGSTTALILSGHFALCVPSRREMLAQLQGHCMVRFAVFFNMDVMCSLLHKLEESMLSNHIKKENPDMSATCIGY